MANSAKNKVISIVLCLVMILLPLMQSSMFAFAEDNLSNASVTVTPSEDVYVSDLENAVLTAEADGKGDLQWQIYSAEHDMWINIYGETDEECVLTYAKVYNMLDKNDTTKVRCVLNTDGGAVASEAVKVEAEEIGEMPAMAKFSLRSAAEEPAEAAVVDEPAVAEAGEELKNYSIVINYVFADGKQAANPWTATVAAGSDFNQTIKSPSVLGYTPDAESIKLNYTDIAENKTVTVTYSAALVDYTVIHYQQNLNDDKHTEVAREAKKGYTESAVGDGLAKNYEGFYALLYDTTTKIAADGSTVVEIYYDRYYYLMSFDLAGGYGVEPIYAKYGTPIEVGAPTRAGYTFTGWDKTVPTTMPKDGGNYTAQWEAGTTSFTVVFWYENANDDNYTSVGSTTIENVTSGSEISSGTYKDTTFEDRDDEHFTYNANKAETVTVVGDGSTVLNVYFTRNTYTITFVGDLLVCGKVEHKHSHEECCTRTGFHISCNSNKCPVGYEHEHSYGGGWGQDSCYEENQTIKTVTAKYDSDISSTWKTDPIKSMLDDGYVFQSSITDKYYSFLEKMPGYDITMTATAWSGNTYTWYYYLEVLPGMDTTGLTTRTDNGKTYYLYDDTKVNGSNLSLTYEEDYYPITGFTQRDDVVPSFSNRTAYLYYTRNSYDLSFINYGTEVSGAGGTYLYQADISDADFTPTYPSTLEPGAYVFDGWYTSPFFGDTKFSFNSEDEDGNPVKATMPAHDVILYARWVPTTHNVNVYLTSEMDEAEKLCDTQVVNHGENAIEPEEPTNGSYTFVGWFYMDGNTEKAFDFSMPVNKDLNLYAKWSSNVLMEYVIHYKLADGTTIAEDTTGSALAGTTKTFEAKAGDELNEGYQSGYFPNTNSHSLTIDIDDESKNEFTFVYTPKEKVPYVVKYLEFETGTVLHKQKEAVTRDAVITEMFEPITGYMPDAYQKRLVLSADETQNVIIFWYVKDAVHAPVQIIHYIQNAEGDGYTEYQSSTDLNGVIGQSYSEDVLTIAGFDYDRATANDEAVTAADGKVTGTVTANGLILELYYNRELHPYEFRFLEQGTDKVLADPVTGTARYGSQVAQNAKNISGYTLVSPEAQAITIQIEDGTTVDKNVRIFYYTEDDIKINYVAKTGGSVSLDSETIKAATGNPAGSTATASAGYTFEGWYSDEECTTKVSDKATFVPEKNEAGVHFEATYYAKFVEDDVTINYVAKNGGTVSKATETIKAATGNPVGSTATASAGYTFEGWYSDEACIKRVSGDAHYVPQKNNEGAHFAATYYAKFTENEVTISYKAVDPEGNVLPAENAIGTVSPGSETLKVVNGVASGSIATAKTNYRFVGWFTDEACTNPVVESAVDANNKFVPVKPGNLWTEAIYYAKFEYDVQDLTIIKEIILEDDETIDADQTFVFEIKGTDGRAKDENINMVVTIKGNDLIKGKGKASITIEDLPLGTYKVIEDESWSWRFDATSTPENGQITLNPGVDAGEITISNAYNEEKDKWLNDVTNAVNKFKPVAE